MGENATKLYARSASTMAGRGPSGRGSPPLAEAPWTAVDASSAAFLPKDLLDAFLKGARANPRSLAGAPPEADTIDFRSEGRLSAGTAQVDKRTGRVGKVEARQVLAVAPGIEMVTAATVSLSDFGAPVAISAPGGAISRGTERETVLSNTATISETTR